MNRTELRAFLKRSTNSGGVSPIILDTITKCARASQTVIIAYADTKGVITAREVEPYEFKEDKLWAYCLVRQGVRQFTFGSIVSAMPTGRVFTPRWPIQI